MLSAVRIQTVSKKTASQISIQLVDAIIELQQGWKADRRSADPETGFLATCFCREEVQEYFENGGTFFFAQSEGGLEGFALTTSIDEFIDQYRTVDGCTFEGVPPPNLQQCVYLYQVVVRRGTERKGIGRELVRAVSLHHKSEILADVLVSPVPNYPSIRFFQQLGYFKVGELHLSQYRDFGQLVSHVYLAPRTGGAL